MSRSSRGAASRVALLVVTNLGVLLLLLVLMEGCSSAVLLTYNVLKTPPLAERLHTRYDAELGWVNVPGVRIPDMYGEGIGLTTNQRGFRGAREVSDAVPAGRLRVICSGDSFTLGYGVGDDETWCARLEQAGGIEAVNMGQGGYGLDQAYLWYLRDGVRLQHQVHILAFITDDVRRMRFERFISYPKPVLVPEGDSIRVANVPVPRRSGFITWLNRNAASFGDLRMVQLTARMAGRSAGAARNPAVLDNDEVRHVIAWLVKDLADRHAAAGRTLILVHLPTDYELRGAAPPQWQPFFGELAAQLGIEYIDLFPQFQSLPDSTLAATFLRPGEVQFPSAAGHLTALGNDMVARLLRPYLPVPPE